MNKESLEKMSRMRLLGIHQSFKCCIESDHAQTFTNDELVHHLIQSEWDDRQYRALQCGLNEHKSPKGPKKISRSFYTF